MQERNLLPRSWLIAFTVASLSVLAACGSPAASKSQSNPPPAQGNASYAQPTTPAVAAQSSGESGPSSGGDRPEGGPSIASVTDPGGLPPSPPTSDPLINRLGEEKMVVFHDQNKRYQVLFVNGWQTSAVTTTTGVLSANKDRSAQIDVVSSGGKSAMDYATADEGNLKTAVPGYQTIVLKPGQIPYGAVVSLIYSYQAGQNPVTGKTLNYLAARVYVHRQNSNDLAIITVTGPAPFYGDLTEIFDRIVNSFKWM
ncbi:MAG: hypothetical protein M1570_03865 [Chloroflexi bacterium]|nr:hypothetical protein [Chloroflexota bacterium]